MTVARIISIMLAERLGVNNIEIQRGTESMSELEGRLSPTILSN
jgi:hypothetical protein